MLTKCTAIFELATNVSDPTLEARRLGGWSEGFYDASEDPKIVRRDWESLCSKRAALLPKGAAIVGQRYQQVNPVGPSSTTGKRFPGNAAYGADIPQMALYCKAPGLTVRNVRPLMLRGIPDGMVKEGEFSPTDVFERNLLAFFAELRGYQFRARRLDGRTAKIFSIDNDGTVTLESDFNSSPNDIVVIGRTRDENSISRTLKAKIATVTSARVWKVSPWTFGPCKGGRVTDEEFIFPVIDHANIAASRITTRRVGRPFTQYRGRASKKR